MINWREKFVATAIHFLVTLSLAAVAAALVFLVWFPNPLETMIGGTELFMLVVGCDLALGPLVSLVIYNSKKSRGKLILDYSLFGAVQIAALVYGVYILAGTRPLYIAFSTDRLEVVTARDLSDKELAAARDPAYSTRTFTGPRFIGIDVPLRDYNDAVLEALKGNEEHMRPKFYVPYESQLARIRTRARGIDELAQKMADKKPLLDEAMRGVSIPAERVRWLPVHHFKGFWTALIDIDDGKPVAYVNFDPL
ncbi:MAG TPA: hypothetical protein VFS58_13340 [Steroidobacteraceae bacterium]|nr:hypothetical protein [Steroidobacteraceae bacterium]